MNAETLPGAGPVDEPVVQLLPCAMCGGEKGYSLREGINYRWWNVQCNECGRIVDECISDRRTHLGGILPDRWGNADQAWNEAGQHAADLMADAHRYRLLRRGQHWSVVDGIGNTLRGEVLDAAIDVRLHKTESQGR